MNAADKIDMKLHTNWISPEIFERNVAISTSEKVDTVFINIVANCMLAPSRRHLAAAINRHTRIAAVHNTIPHCFFYNNSAAARWRRRRRSVRRARLSRFWNVKGPAQRRHCAAQAPPLYTYFFFGGLVPCPVFSFPYSFSFWLIWPCLYHRTRLLIDFFVLQACRKGANLRDLGFYETCSLYCCSFFYDHCSLFGIPHRRESQCQISSFRHVVPNLFILQIPKSWIAMPILINFPQRDYCVEFPHFIAVVETFHLWMRCA